jgi:hypothetical protein
MYIQFLVEDSSGAALLQQIVSRLLGPTITYDIKSYKGVGRLPTGLKPTTDPRKRLLLDQLPRLVQGYGKTFASYPHAARPTLVIVCDLDNRCMNEFRRDLLDCIESCSKRPSTIVCFAVEEMEAWILGDKQAVISAYPKARTDIIDDYLPDSICGTWEVLADALCLNGSARLASQGYHAIGAKKHEWATRIGPFIDEGRNLSPSFRYFRQKLDSLSEPKE